MITARARDAAGNTAISWSVTVTVSNATPSGLVLALGFNQTSGATATDLSGLGNHGTVSGAAWSSSGRFGGALSFDGTNDLVTIADTASLDLTTGMTLEAWVNPSAVNADWRTVMLKERPSGLAYALYGADGANRPPASYVTVNGDKAAVGTATLPLGSWAHLASTFDGSSLRMYVDGALVRTIAAAGAISVSTGALRIGGNNVWGEYFSGLIDEVRVYNRALTQAEVQGDMNTAIGEALFASAAAIDPGENSQSITDEALNVLRNEAIARWETAGVSAAAIKALQDVPVHVSDLPGLQLGLASHDAIWVDIDGAGHGWFVDRTPTDDREFPAIFGMESFGRMDLLTALLHEYGHLLEQVHRAEPHSVMADSLLPGERGTPEYVAVSHETRQPTTTSGSTASARFRSLPTSVLDALYASTEAYRTLDDRLWGVKSRLARPAGLTR